MELIKKLKLFIIRRISLAIDYNIIISRYQQEKIRNCYLNVDIRDKSIFYEQARVENLAGRPNLIKIGSKCHIRGELLVFKYGGSIEIGNNCYIGEGTRIWSGQNVSIGNDVLISHNVNILDTNSHEINSQERSLRFLEIVELGHWEKQGNVLNKSILIGNNVWINFNATILKGVTIGEGAIIGANSLVTKDVQPWTIVAGNPAKLIRVITESER